MLRKMLVAPNNACILSFQACTLTCYLPAQDLRVEQFVERFERPRLPVVITGLCDSWKGQERWTEESLVRHYGEHKFKVCHEQLRILCKCLLWLVPHCYMIFTFIRPNFSPLI